MAKINPQDLKDRLLAPGFTAPPVLEQLSDPISDTPMVLTSCMPLWTNSNSSGC